jgi:hypothetical protein
MKFDLWQIIIIQNDFGILTMAITKISILHKPVPMKHCYWNLCSFERHSLVLHTNAWMYNF